MSPIVFILICIAVILICIAFNASERSKKEAARAEQQERKREKREQERESLAAAEEELFSVYGQPTKKIQLRYSYDLGSIEGYAYVFTDAEVLSLYGEPIHFSQILRYELRSEEKNVTTKEEKTSEGDFWDTLGKADAGRMIGGRNGALAGVASAPKTTNTKTSATTYRNWTVVIYVDDIGNPVRTVSLGAHEDAAHALAGVLEVITSRNKN